MRHPVQIIKIIGLLLLLLLFFMSVTMTVQAAEEITLLNIQKHENPDYTQIIFNFSSSPKFAMEHSGQRVELLLNNVKLSPKLQNLPEDENFVKYLLVEKKHELLVSVLLRRHPKKVLTESNQNSPQIVMNVHWDTDDIARPAEAFRIADMPPRKAGRRAARFQQESPK